MLKLIIGVVVATVIVVFVFSVINANVGSDSGGDGISVVSTDANYLTLTITGQVTKPGTYVIHKDGTIGELILAAGGVTSNADARSYMEDITLEKGVSYYIAPLNDLNDYCGESPLEKVNINTGTKEELLTVKGIGNTIAGDLITYRNENGDFTYIEQLMKVKGIGKSTFENLKNYVIIR